MQRSGLVVSVVAAAAAVLAACTPDSGCFEQVASGWIALPDGGPDGGAASFGDAAADVVRRPPVVVVNGEDSGPLDGGAVNRDDAGAAADAAAGDTGVGSTEGGAADAGPGPTDAATGATDAVPGATDAAPGATDAGHAVADGGAESWESLTCDRICARLLDPAWVIRGCRPPVRGDSGRLYVYCEAAASTCVRAD